MGCRLQSTCTHTNTNSYRLRVLGQASPDLINSCCIVRPAYSTTKLLLFLFCTVRLPSILLGRLFTVSSSIAPQFRFPSASPASYPRNNLVLSRDGSSIPSRLHARCPPARDPNKASLAQRQRKKVISHAGIDSSATYAPSLSHQYCPPCNDSTSRRVSLLCILPFPTTSTDWMCHTHPSSHHWRLLSIGPPSLGCAPFLFFPSRSH